MLEQTGTAKKLTGQILENWLVSFADGHGGIQTITKTGTSGLVDTYTITFADTTTKTFTVTNGKAISSITQYWAVSASSSTVPSQWYTTRQTMTVTNKYLWSYMHYAYNDGTSYDTPYSVIGVYGDTGAQTYVWIKYAGIRPTSDADMGDAPDNYIGIYVGLSATAPTSYTAYTWYQYKGEKGDTGDASEVTAQSVTYLEGTSGTVVPEGSWTTTVPSVTPGNYLWTRTQLTFNDNTSITAYSVSRFGIDGTGSVSSVNNQSPDTNGNVALTASNIPTSDSESVQDKLDASATVEDLATYTRPNLLDNWYFVGGGSQLGYGTFPINQRGQTSYGNSNTYTVDRWKLTDGSFAVVSGGITLNGTIEQILSSSIGLPVFASALLSDGTMITPSYNDSTKTFTLTATGQTIIAVKLEIGNTQTLAHQENGTWVLNEIPNYANELVKCMAYLEVIDFPASYARVIAGGISGTSLTDCRIFLHSLVPMKSISLLSVTMIGNLYVRTATGSKKISSFQWGNCYSSITLAPTLESAFSSNQPIISLETMDNTAKLILSSEL